MACVCIYPRCVSFTSLPLRLQLCVLQYHQLQRRYLQLEHGEPEEFEVRVLPLDKERGREALYHTAHTPSLFAPSTMDAAGLG